MIKRVVSAFVLVPIVVYLVLKANLFWFNLSILLLSSLAYSEWLGLDNRSFNFVKSLYLSCFFILAFVFAFNGKFFDVVLFLIVIVHLVINLYHLEEKNFLINQYYFTGIFYALLYFFASKMIKFSNGRILLLVVFVTIWSSDTFAFFCGKSFGKIKLAPVVSPKKTVEGAICGVILGTVVGVGFGLLLKLPAFDVFLISFVSNISGIVGDLAESVPKRFFGKKDSSNLIPGHGGILDRLDSFAFAVFFSYLVMLCKVYWF